MALYNVTALSESSDLWGVASFANDSAGGLLWGGFLLAWFFIMMLSLRGYNFEDNLLVSSWACFIIGLFLSYAGLVNTIFVFGFLLIAGGVAFYKVVLRR